MTTLNLNATQVKALADALKAAAAAFESAYMLLDAALLPDQPPAPAPAWLGAAHARAAAAATPQAQAIAADIEENRTKASLAQAHKAAAAAAQAAQDRPAPAPAAQANGDAKAAAKGRWDALVARLEVPAARAAEVLKAAHGYYNAASDALRDQYDVA
jgi:hypothetical protein